jgi:hypothetical protein
MHSLPLYAKIIHISAQKKVKKQPASSPHLNGKYHPLLLVVVVLEQQLLIIRLTTLRYSGI